jgi:protein transport protein SEC20
MAPAVHLMSSSLEVSEVQEELVKVNLAMKMLNEEFSECSDERAMEALNESARTQLGRFRDRIKDLRRLADEQRRPEAREMLLKDVANHQGQLATCQRQFREANLRCILYLQRQDKEMLMRGDKGEEGEDSLKQRRRSRNRDTLVRETGHVTDSLSAISRQLAAAVERSAMTVGELAQSSQTVTETQEEFKNMGSVIGQSRKLITKFGRRETTDRVLIFFAFAFFFACVFYVLRKRVLGPLDPFALVWSTLATLVTTVMSLLGF